MKSTEGHGRALSEINVTPFVDVVLVLLIVFMITAPLLSQGLDVELPEANAPALQKAEEDIIITMNKEGKLFLQGDPTPYTLDTIGAKLETAFAHRRKRDLLFQADRNITYGVVVKAIALFKGIGVERVGMVTEEEKIKR